MSQLTDLPAWQNLVKHFEKTKDVHMRDLFAQDPTDLIVFRCGSTISFSITQRTA